MTGSGSSPRHHRATAAVCYPAPACCEAAVTTDAVRAAVRGLQYARAQLIMLAPTYVGDTNAGLALATLECRPACRPGLHVGGSTPCNGRDRHYLGRGPLRRDLALRLDLPLSD